MIKKAKNNFFQFSKFKVGHDKCAMKVGTDGVLLGAWTKVIFFKSLKKRILDIGSGSGLISLMLAQKMADSFDCDFTINSVELEKNAALQSKENFNLSPWKDNLTVYNIDINKFNATKFDLIVSNPPFFDNCLSSDQKSRNIARKEDSLSRKDLIDNVRRLLLPNGHFSLIIPASDEGRTIGFCWEVGLYLSRKCRVYGKPDKKEPIRVLLDFSLKRGKIEHSELILRDENNVETQKYKSLIADFML